MMAEIFSEHSLAKFVLKVLENIYYTILAELTTVNSG